jgi:hypothetical protein
MAQRFEHCRLSGSHITYLGRSGIFENKSDKPWSESKAWDMLQKEGWELVSVISDSSTGEITAFFKRLVEPETE